MYNKSYVFYNINISNNFIYLIYDKQNMLYIYILYLKNKIFIYFYILNNIYIFFKNYIYNISCLLFKMYKYIYIYINKNFKIINKYKLIINIIGLSYKLYFIDKYNYLIFQLKYNHKIILKLPKLIYCNININKNIIYLFSDNLILLNTIGKLIESFQYINKYKKLGICIVK